MASIKFPITTASSGAFWPDYANEHEHWKEQPLRGNKVTNLPGQQQSPHSCPLGSCVVQLLQEICTWKKAKKHQKNNVCSHSYHRYGKLLQGLHLPTPMHWGIFWEEGCILYQYWGSNAMELTVSRVCSASPCKTPARSRSKNANLVSGEWCL